MQRFTLRHGAALLAALALGACDATPTAVRPAASPGDVRAVITPASSLSVTNSGGYPLVSWTAPAGATGFTVKLISYNTVNGNYHNRFFTTLGTTAGTSFLDTSQAYTGSHDKCELEGPDGNLYGGWYEYEIVSTFVDGTSSARIYAPVGDC